MELLIGVKKRSFFIVLLTFVQDSLFATAIATAICTTDAQEEDKLLFKWDA